jgi:hypothetical protein
VARSSPRPRFERGRSGAGRGARPRRSFEELPLAVDPQDGSRCRRPEDALDARPIDLAVASAAGLARVEQAIAAARKDAV